MSSDSTKSSDSAAEPVEQEQTGGAIASSGKGKIPRVGIFVCHHPVNCTNRIGISTLAIIVESTNTNQVSCWGNTSERTIVSYGTTQRYTCYMGAMTVTIRHRVFIKYRIVLR